MRDLRHHLAALFALSAGVLLFVACGDEGPGGACQIGNPDEGGVCPCKGTDCVCPSAGNCLINCVEGCNLQCAGSGSCDFFCAGGCNTECTGSGNCVVDVGDNSSVACTGSGDCDVYCAGDCTVACPGSATCTVGCAEGAACAITIEKCPGQVAECPDGVKVCNGACPG